MLIAMSPMTLMWLVALILFGVLILAVGFDPVSVYGAMFNGALAPVSIFSRQSKS